MDYKKKMIDGVEYYLLTDEDIEDIKVMYRNEQQIKEIEENNISGVDADMFLQDLRTNYGL